MYKRRVIIFLVIMGLGLSVEAVRLWQLQVTHASDYQTDAMKPARRVELIPVQRGALMDRTGVVLARDKDCRDLCMDYRFMVSDPEWVKRQVRQLARERGISKAAAGEAYAELSGKTWDLVYRVAAEQLAAESASTSRPADTRQIAGTAREGVDAIVERVKARVAHLREMVGQDVQEERHAHVVVAGLDESLAVRVREAVERGEVVGLTVAEGSQRVYHPNASLACHLIGYAGPVNAAEQRAMNIPAGEADSLERLIANYLDADVIGKAGAERLCEHLLRGRRGYKEFGEPDSEPTVTPGQNGQDVRLSIDLELQARTVAAFQRYQPGRNGAVVAIDIRTGEVLAMVSLPTYELGTMRRDMGTLNHDEVNYPLLNRAVARAYEPGSTAKPMAALAALSEGVINENTTFACNHTFGPLKCMGTHGAIAVQRAIRKSCNIFFYHVGLEMERHRPGALCAWFEKFGLRDVCGTQLREERPGNVPRTTDANEAQQLAIGQSRILATPMHVANEMATIARGGTWMAPTVLADNPDPRPTRSLGLAAAHVNVIKRGMYEVANEAVDVGTAYKVFHDPAVPPLGFKIAGKTGTAQTAVHWKDFNGNHRLDADEVIHKGDWAWFASFAPYDNPQVAFAVVVEYVDSGTGATNAGPIAREMLRAWADLGYIRK